MQDQSRRRRAASPIETSYPDHKNLLGLPEARAIPGFPPDRWPPSALVFQGIERGQFSIDSRRVCLIASAASHRGEHRIARWSVEPVVIGQVSALDLAAYC